MTAQLRQLFREPDPLDPSMTVAERLVKIAYIQAAKGNFQFFKEIWDRTEGKVPDKVEATLTDGWQMQYDDAEATDEDRPRIWKQEPEGGVG